MARNTESATRVGVSNEGMYCNGSYYTSDFGWQWGFPCPPYEACMAFVPYGYPTMPYYDQYGFLYPGALPYYQEWVPAVIPTSSSSRESPEPRLKEISEEEEKSQQNQGEEPKQVGEDHYSEHRRRNTNSRESTSQRPKRSSSPREERPRPKIVDKPVNSLTPEEKSDYKLFKQMYEQRATKETTTEEEWTTYRRVYDDYARYAGIPEVVGYTLDYKTVDRNDLDSITRYYQSYEWDKTQGWSSRERVSLLDHDALDIGTKSKGKQPAQNDEGSPTRRSRSSKRRDEEHKIYVVLMHCVPDAATTLANRTGDEPVACFQTMGDVLYTINGKDNCKQQLHDPPKVTHKLKGKIALCGYKGGGNKMIVRGRQDVGRIYSTIHGEYH